MLRCALHDRSGTFCDFLNNSIKWGAKIAIEISDNFEISVVLFNHHSPGLLTHLGIATFLVQGTQAHYFVIKS